MMNREQLEQTWKLITPPVEVIAIPPGGAPTEVRIVADEGEFVSFCEEYEGSHNLYHKRGRPTDAYLERLGILRAGLRKHTSRRGIAAIEHVHWDFDVPKRHGGKTSNTSATDDETQRVLQVAKTFVQEVLEQRDGGPVACYVVTGSGVRVTIPTAPIPIGMHEAGRYEATLRYYCEQRVAELNELLDPSLRDDYEADHCLCRVNSFTRIVGTTNLKPNGEEGRPAGRESYWVLPPRDDDAGIRREMADMIEDAAYEHAVSPGKRAAAATVTPRTPSTPAKSAELPAAFAETLRDDPLMKWFWDGADGEAAQDASRNDYRLAMALFERGYALEDVSAILANYPHGKYQRERRSDYLMRTVTKARDDHGKKRDEPKALIQIGDTGSRPADPREHSTPSVETPALPTDALIDPSLAASGCAWLDDYCQWSAKESNLGYEYYHELAGLFVLSTVAARRIRVRFGVKQRFTNLYLLMVGASGEWAKSTTGGLARLVLDTAGFRSRMAPDVITPQKLIEQMAAVAPKNWDQLPELDKTLEKERLQFCGQKGWFFDEFGQQLDSMTRANSYNADFMGVLRRLDDCPAEYASATIARGVDRVVEPYLSLLGILTIEDLKPTAGKGSSMWRNGFWARVLFACPPRDCAAPTDIDFLDPSDVPNSLIDPLREWDEQLGIPSANVVAIASDNDKKAKAWEVARDDLPCQECAFDHQAIDAIRDYSRALKQAGREMDMIDLKPNYDRLHERMLRIAMLFASLEGNGRIELHHLAKAQQITEHCREGLHHLYQEVNETAGRELENRVISILRKNGATMTARQIAQRIHGTTTAEIDPVLDSLAKSSVVVSKPTRRTSYYALAP
jgi:hypothetical protein